MKFTIQTYVNITMDALNEGVEANLTGVPKWCYILGLVFCAFSFPAPPYPSLPFIFSSPFSSLLFHFLKNVNKKQTERDQHRRNTCKQQYNTYYFYPYGSLDWPVTKCSRPVTSSTHLLVSVRLLPTREHLTRSSAIAERPRGASYHWIFC